MPLLISVGFACGWVVHGAWWLVRGGWWRWQAVLRLTTLALDLNTGSYTSTSCAIILFVVRLISRVELFLLDTLEHFESVGLSLSLALFCFFLSSVSSSPHPLPSFQLVCMENCMRWVSSLHTHRLSQGSRLLLAHVTHAYMCTSV